MFSFIRSHLAWKLFLSFVIVILVGVVVLATATSLSVPAAFDQHLAGMSAMMSGSNMMGNARPIEMVLFTNYKAAVTEALSLAAAALIAAVLASFFISRKVVGPVQRMMMISHRIAEGEYEQRLTVSGSVPSPKLDDSSEYFHCSSAKRMLY